jgi:hypothetical protein
MKSREAINGQRNFKGRIVGVEGDKVVFDDNTSPTLRLTWKKSFGSRLNARRPPSRAAVSTTE